MEWLRQGDVNNANQNFTGRYHWFYCHCSYHDKEYFSGIAMAVSAPGQEIKSFYIGKVSHNANSKPITRDTLFEIGSISFPGHLDEICRHSSHAYTDTAYRYQNQIACQFSH